MNIANFLRNHFKLVASIAFLVLAALFFIGIYRLNFVYVPEYDPAKDLQVTKTDLGQSEVPELFPKDIPIEKGALITQNYNATSADGRFQATRSFETKKTLAENYKIYKEFFQKNGWNILSEVDIEDYKMVFASKDLFQVQVSMSNNTVNQVKTVDISLTRIPGKTTTKSN